MKNPTLQEHLDSRRHEFFAVFMKALDAFRLEDPNGLIRSGAPWHEFAVESEELAWRLSSGEIVDAQAIQDVWEFMFDERLPLRTAQRLERAVNR